jgi:Uma2 family endonuclease
MLAPAIMTPTMTADEFMAFVLLPENADKTFELIEGVPVEMPSSSQKNTVIAMRIGHFFNAWVIPRDLGFVSGADGGYRLNDNNVYQPDVAFISKARHAELSGVEFPIAPDIAVEIISASEDSIEVLRKAGRYIATGTQRVWLVYEKEKAIFVCQPGSSGNMDIKEYGIQDILDGGTVLPGFTLKIRDIFP